MKQLRVIKKSADAGGGGNWSTAKNFFPHVDVDQNTGTVRVTVYDNSGFQKKVSVETKWIKIDTKKDSSFIRGEVEIGNWVNRKLSGCQKFCFAIFQGDSGHIYTHRAPATKGWMNAKPQEIRKRLRKLGVGVDEVAYQQGDFLLKKANGGALPDDMFKHESMGAGHHKFDAPVLYSNDSTGKRQYWVTERVILIHMATDGIQHPTLTIEPGKYIVGTTASSLRHDNLRD